MEESVIPNFESGTEPEKKKKKKDKEAKEELSFERTELALYRTQLAMLRTTTTLTTFGFALYKLLQQKVEEPGQHPILQIISPRVVAITLFFTGFLGLILHSFHHVRVLKKINRFNKGFYSSSVMIMSYVILVLTLFLLIGAILNN
jgi:uncharacterized membrane protein YidH (DUF202 family)